MSQLQLPKIGLRTLKTAIAVFLCLFLFPSEPFFACMTAVFCMQDTISNSFRMAFVRGCGTAVGGTIGLIFLLFCRAVRSIVDYKFLASILIYAIIAIGVITVICTWNFFKHPQCIPISCIVFLGVTTAHAYTDPFYYAFNRVCETFFGIFIALLVNKYINPPSEVTEEAEVESQPLNGIALEEITSK